MKRAITILLALVMMLSLAACGNKDAATTSPNPTGTAENTSDPMDEDPSEAKVIYTYEGEPTDLFTIEEIEFAPDTVPWEDDAQFFAWKMKVRNTSGADLPAKESSMRIWFNYLDENEDIVFSFYESAGYSSTIENGKAVLIDCSSIPGNLNKKQLESIAYIEIYGYTNTLHGMPDYEFSCPIIVDVKEQKVIQAPSADTNASSLSIDTVLTSNEWIRKTPSGNLVTLVFEEDGTGFVSYSSNIEDSAIEWQIDEFQIITIKVYLSGDTATTENRLEEENGVFKLVEISENGHKNIDLEKNAWTIK